MARERPTISIDKFVGLHTTDDSYEVGLDGLVTATNVDITRKHKVVRRKGFNQKLAATPSAAWSNDRTMLYQQGTDLYSVDFNYIATQIRSGLSPSATLVGYQIGKLVYWSNGIDTGVIEDGYNRSLGLTPPPVAELTPLSAGSLPKGTYQVVATFVRADGFESGATIPAPKITVSDNYNSVIVTGLTSLDASVVAVNYYITKDNGSIFFFAGAKAPGVNITISQPADQFSRPLKDLHGDAPYPFICIDHFNGRTIYASGNFLFFSDPFIPERVDLTKSYIPFNDKVTMIGVVDDGIFVGTEREIIYMDGNSLDNFSSIQVAPYGVVHNTRSYIDSTVVGEDSTITKKIPAWISLKGVCIGFPDGSMQNTTENTVTLPEGTTGASFFRQENGQNHFISVIRS